MRTVLVATAIVISATAAQAQYDCSGNVPRCVRAGGTQAGCSAPHIMSNCARTGTYVSPSGRTYAAVPGRKR